MLRWKQRGENVITVINYRTKGKKKPAKRPAVVSKYRG